MEAKSTNSKNGNSDDGSISKGSNTDGKVPESGDECSEFVHTHKRTAPNNDPLGAVGTLYGGLWLSSTAVELALTLMCSAGIWIFNSSF